MKKRVTKEHDISTVAALLLLGVFAVCILSVLLTGAKAYRKLTERDHTSFEQRTCVQYIATKVRQAPAEVQVEPFGDGDALVLSEKIGDETYLTRVYCHNGYLMELFTSDTDEFAPEDGEQILSAQALSLQLDRDLLTVCVTDEQQQTAELKLSLRCTEGGRS